MKFLRIRGTRPVFFIQYQLLFILKTAVLIFIHHSSGVGKLSYFLVVWLVPGRGAVVA